MSTGSSPSIYSSIHPPRCLSLSDPLAMRSFSADATTDEEERDGGRWQTATADASTHLFNHNDLESCFCEPGGRADASDASPDDDDPLASVLSLAHGCGVASWRDASGRCRERVLMPSDLVDATLLL